MADLQKHYPFPLNEEQKKALQYLLDFINDQTYQAFILRGYAGTGKTSLVLGMVKYLLGKEIPVCLLASTGRAARVLQLKSRAEACTVHRYIYRLVNKVVDEKAQEYKMFFQLRTNHDPEETVYIVDESSMLSDHKTESHLEFGTGKVLSDLFLFLNGRKVIFIGDACQLPPVNTAFSPALVGAELQRRFGAKTLAFDLKQVMRFTQQSGIYCNFERYLRIIESRQNARLLISTAQCDDIIKIDNQLRMIEAYTDMIKNGAYHQAIWICHSNKAVNTINRTVRGIIFGDYGRLLPGESLMVVQNNYNVNLNNGDLVKVKEVSNNTIQRANMHFRPVILSYGIGEFTVDIRIFLIDELLFSDEPNITQQQYYELIKDFNIRMYQKGIKQDSQEYVDRIMTDPFVNALRAKFGYALTCHKAQGGEWSNTFVLFENSLGLMDSYSLHRWAYTAITRTTGKMHVLNNGYVT